MYRINFLLFLLLVSFNGFSQKLTGSVTIENAPQQETAVGALIHWKGSTQGVFSDSIGHFEIALPDSFPSLLITNLVGYRSDTLVVNSPTAELHIQLSSSVQLKEVQVSTSTANYSTLKPINTELIMQKDLLKAACCNISESFSSSASVDVAFTDAVSGAKKIQMLGLDGIYTQVLAENIPFLRGLSAAYGLSNIPGTWIKGIMVTKGTGSVVNGYESISGQINLEFLQPEEQKKRFFINVYGNHKGRGEANVHFGKKFNDHWSTLLFTHASSSFLKQDMNKDGFLDMPQNKQYTVFNRWNYHSGKHLEAQLGIKGMYDERIGGQTGFVPSHKLDSTTGYGIVIRNRQLDYFSKTGWVFPATPYRSIGIQTSGKWQLQDMYFGLRQYSGEQKNWYANLIYADILGNTDHKYKVGLSYLYDNYKERFMDSSMTRIESVPGVFAEYTYTHGDDFTMVAGIRADQHQLYGMQVTPRLHLRYQPFPKTTVRFSGGKGFRTANVFVENQAVLASSRKVVIAESFVPEVAWNYGFSLNQEFKLFQRDAAFSVDFFRTDFQHQVVVDVDKDPGLVVFSNLHGTSYSNSFQAELGMEPVESFTVKLAYKWYDVHSTYHGMEMSKPYVPGDRVLLSLSYSTYRDIWKFDVTGNWFSTARIPSTATNPTAYQRGVRSDPYMLLQAQITKKFRKFDWYVGAENILNQTQKDPLIASGDPFGPYFDASMVYAPLEGTVIYTGIRLEIK